MEAIVKFFVNDEASLEAKMISKTFGKVAVIARAVYSKRKSDPSVPWPEDQEFWRVKVLKELRRGVKGGCFLVEPIEKVDKSKVLHLLPGMYTTRVHHGCLIVTPNEEYRDKACILPLDHKHVFSENLSTYCCIVDVSSKESKVTTAPKRTTPYGPR